MSRDRRLGRRGGSGGPGLYTPPVAGALWHFEPADLAAGDVASWTSRVNGYSVAQSTAGNRPAAVASAINGQPAVLFTASATEYLVSADATPVASLTGTAAYTLFEVLDAASVAAYRVHLCFGDTTTALQGDHYVRVTTGVDGWVRAATNGDGTRALTSPCVLTTAFSGTTYSSWVNGLTSRTNEASSAAINAQRLVLGARMTSGNIELPYDGYIGTVLCYAGVLPSAQRLAVESWLRRRYGV